MPIPGMQLPPEIAAMLEERGGFTILMLDEGEDDAADDLPNPDDILALTGGKEILELLAAAGSGQRALEAENAKLKAELERMKAVPQIEGTVLDINLPAFVNPFVVGAKVRLISDRSGLFTEHSREEGTIQRLDDSSALVQFPDGCIHPFETSRLRPVNGPAKRLATVFVGGMRLAVPVPNDYLLEVGDVVRLHSRTHAIMSRVVSEAVTSGDVGIITQVLDGSSALVQRNGHGPKLVALGKHTGFPFTPGYRVLLDPSASIVVRPLAPAPKKERKRRAKQAKGSPGAMKAAKSGAKRRP